MGRLSSTITLMSDDNKSVETKKSEGKYPGKMPSWQRVAVMVGIGFTFTWVFSLITSPSYKAAPLTLNQAVSLIDAGDVKKVRMDEDGRTAILEKKDGKILKFSYPYGYSNDLTLRLLEKKIPVTVDPTVRPSFFSTLISSLFPILLLVGLLVLFTRKSGGGGLFGVGKMGKGKDSPVEVPVDRFTDLAGVDEAVLDMKEIVDFLKEPEKYTAVGASIPRGVLLVGPPGTGKTLLARAVAGEAGVPFFALSGSDFVEMFVGVGASRVRNLFGKARESGRAIVFIDEIDAVGKTRINMGSNGASEERESTLNALLVEMDGFAKTQVIVLAATNRADVLDSALLRPGRFDRKITVNVPDRKGREDLLRLYASKREVDSDIDFKALAKRIPGMSGADIAALFNEASLLCARRVGESISEKDLAEAIAVVYLGRERKSAVVTLRDREITAWHEAGHAVVAMLDKDADDPVSVTIVPRGQTGGVTWLGGSDHSYTTKSQALARLRIGMGGRAGEELLLDGDYTQGAVGDLSSATALATEMVSSWGMGERLANVMEQQLFMGGMGESVHLESDRLIVTALSEAREVLSSNLPYFKAVAEKLLDAESLDLKELKAIAEDMGLTLPKKLSDI